MHTHIDVYFNMTDVIIIRPDIHLISSQELDDLDYLDGVDPEDFSIHPDLEKLVESHRWKWVDDALGVVPHCLSMLKGQAQSFSFLSVDKIIFLDLSRMPSHE